MTMFTASGPNKQFLHCRFVVVVLAGHPLLLVYNGVKVAAGLLLSRGRRSVTSTPSAGTEEVPQSMAEGRRTSASTTSTLAVQLSDPVALLAVRTNV